MGGFGHSRRSLPSGFVRLICLHVRQQSAAPFRLFERSRNKQVQFSIVELFDGFGQVLRQNMAPILRKGDLLCRWSWRWLFGRCRRREQIGSCLLSAVTSHGGRSWRHRILQATGSNRFAEDNAPCAPGSCRARVAQCPRCSGDQATSLGTSEGSRVVPAFYCWILYADRYAGEGELAIGDVHV
jgi:hypothetical protein